MRSPLPSLSWFSSSSGHCPPAIAACRLLHVQVSDWSTFGCTSVCPQAVDVAPTAPASLHGQPHAWDAVLQGTPADVRLVIWFTNPLVSPPCGADSSGDQKAMLRVQDQANRWDRFVRLFRFLEHAVWSVPTCSWVLEWPKSSSMWRLEAVQAFLASHAHHLGLYSSCTWQQTLTCPSGVVRRFVTSDRELAMQLSSTCSRSHEHSSSSQFQPLQVDAFLRAALLLLSAQGPSPALPACSAPLRLRLPICEMQWGVAGAPQPLPPPPGSAAAAASSPRGPAPQGAAEAWSTDE